MAREINLVPDIKKEMIKALKLRNFIFFLCIVISASAIGIMAILGMVVAGQSIALNEKKQVLNEMSIKINSYEDLPDFLTLQNQVEKLNEIADNKNLLSRVFNVLLVLQPTNGDTIDLSDLSVDLSNSTMAFSAQADAKSEPFIDYNVLDAFKKSMNYLTYDYGKYVDKNGDDIPSFCIIEKDFNGTFFAEGDDLFAYWAIERDGCAPKKDAEKETETEQKENLQDNLVLVDELNEEEEVEEVPATLYGYEYETYDETGEKVVKIWRTPKFAEWIGGNKMNLSGDIYNVPHFESECVTYIIVKKNDNIVWEKQNDKCKLVPSGEEGIMINGSSNGIDDTGQLVLRFSAVINLDPEVFRFANYHLIAFGPYGKYNVTDSYTQIQNMFKERAADVDGPESGEE